MSRETLFFLPQMSLPLRQVEGRNSKKNSARRPVIGGPIISMGDGAARTHRRHSPFSILFLPASHSVHLSPLQLAENSSQGSGCGGSAGHGRGEWQAASYATGDGLATFSRCAPPLAAAQGNSWPRSRCAGVLIASASVSGPRNCTN